MRSFRYPLLAAALVLLTARPALCQTSTAPIRDPQAVALVQKAIAAMGTVPSDSTATGAIQVVAGSTSQTGTIQISTLGITSTSETVFLASDQKTTVYSSWSAKETTNGQAVNPPVETILADQCADFPLPFLSSFLANADVTMRYIGLETLNGASAQHVQMWNTFASERPTLQKLAAYSIHDVWFDSTSGLPVKIAYDRRLGGGAVPVIRFEIYFSAYKSLSGVMYPFLINKSFDGTPWQTITISNVTFDAGLTADQFRTE